MVSITNVSSWLGITQKVLGHLAPMKDINEIPEEDGAVVAGIILGGKEGTGGICTILHRSLSKRILFVIWIDTAAATGAAAPLIIPT